MTRIGVAALASALLLSAGALAPPRGSGPFLRALHAQVPTRSGRFLAISRLLMGTPVARDPLGEGPGTVPDPDPRLDLTRVDCVTYVEQCLALALDGAVNDPVGTLDQIRYRRSEVGYATRNHFFIADWIEANTAFVEDVTASLGVPTVHVRKTIDRDAFLAAALGQAPTPPNPIDLVYDWIPCNRIADIPPIPGEARIIVFAPEDPGLDARHVGILDGTVLRHASSEAGRVVEVPFLDYCAAHRWLRGVVVLRVRER